MPVGTPVAVHHISIADVDVPFFGTTGPLLQATHRFQHTEEESIEMEASSMRRNGWEDGANNAPRVRSTH